MPTIEIVSVEAELNSIHAAGFSFAVRMEQPLVSHRGLFQSYLDSIKQGYILHLGNSGFKSETGGGYFGSDLIDWDYMGPHQGLPPLDQTGREIRHEGIPGEFFQFLPEYHVEINALLVQAGKDSSVGRVIFLTDNESGPQKPLHVSLPDVDQWWRLHHTQGLTWNTAYTIG